MQFVQATSFQNAERTPADIVRIVIHTGELEDTPTSAEALAGFFSNPDTEVSAHKTSDSNSVVRCVRDEDIAFHAAGDNERTLGLEIATRASRTKEWWAGAEGSAFLRTAAKTCADWAVIHGIPARWLTATQLRNGAAGFVTHKIVSEVFGDAIRTDPGAEFPYKRFMALVAVYKSEIRWELWANRKVGPGKVRVAVTTWRNGSQTEEVFDSFYTQKRDLVESLSIARRKPEFRRSKRAR